MDVDARVQLESVTKTAAELKSERARQMQRIGRLIGLWSALIVMMMALLAYFYSTTAKFRELERKMTWGSQFEWRDKFKKDPLLDPRLRLVMFDDTTVQALKRSSLNFNEWAEFLSYIDSHKPATIYIDKIFGIIDDDATTLEEALPKLRQLKTKVVVGAFTSSQQIPGRDQLTLSTQRFGGQKFLPDFLKGSSDIVIEQKIRQAGLKDRSKAFVYGPVAQLQEIFHQGHIDYPFANQVFPVYDLGGNRLLPALSLSGSQGMKIEDGVLKVGGNAVPLTKEQSLLVNWINPVKLYGQAISFVNVIAGMNEKLKTEEIPEGSHVLIMPLAFTGNVDFKDSPYGQVPGGFVLGAMINSALTNQWMVDFVWSYQMLFLCILSASLLQLVRGIGSWLLLFLGMAAIALLGVRQFIFHSVDVPWIAGEFFFGGTGMLLLASRSLWDSYRERVIIKLEEDYERLEREEKRLEKEMRDAARVAAALQPEEVPQWPGLEISSFHKSMSEASGDWFFFEKSGSGRLAHFVMCDISGHGVQAALVVSACKTVLSIMRLAEHSPFESSEFLLQYAERLNRILFLNGHGEHTATMVGLTFDFEAGKVFCVDCGHPFPVLHTFGGGHFEALTTTSCDPIGFYEDAKFTMQERKLNFGDCLIAHSDGIPLNRGRRILKKYFSEIDNAPLISAQRLFETLVHHLKKEGLEFAEDDVSLVIFRRTA